LLGQALGDALGFVVEAEPPAVAREYVAEWLLAGRAGERAHRAYPFGQYSDDTQLARELLVAFHRAGGWDPRVFAGRVAGLFRDGRDVGAGKGTRSAALRILMGVAWHEAGTPAPYAGNGSAMRAAPLGLIFSDDPEAMCRAAGEQSRVTHRDPRCAAGAIAVAGAVALAASRAPLDRASFLEQLADWVEREDLSVAASILELDQWASLDPAAAARHVHSSGLDPAHLDRWQGISAFVIPSVLWSLYAFLRSPDDYWMTVCTAIEVGGDTDTMAAIAGAISGGRLGVGALPAPLLGRLTDRGSWGAAELAELARSCGRMIAG
jgi:ADP-ribosylglycohydrolase